MDENEVSLPKFEKINGDEFFEQINQEIEVAQSEQINNGGDNIGEKGQVLYPPINWFVIEINFIDFTCIPCVFSRCVFFSIFLNFLFVASVFSVV